MAECSPVTFVLSATTPQLTSNSSKVAILPKYPSWLSDMNVKELPGLFSSHKKGSEKYWYQYNSLELKYFPGQEVTCDHDHELELLEFEMT